MPFRSERRKIPDTDVYRRQRKRRQRINYIDAYNIAELTSTIDKLTYSFVHLTISVVSKKLGTSEIIKLGLGSPDARDRNAAAAAML